MPNCLSRSLAVAYLTCVVGGADAGLINGSFEQPGTTTSFQFINQASVPGWQTTASDGLIEIWADNFLGVPAYDGEYFAELNATQPSTLFQDAAGISAGSQIDFQFAHRGRLGLDTMRFTMTDLGVDGMFATSDDTILFTQVYSGFSGQWSFHTNPAPISALGNTVRFAFQSVSTATFSPSNGNLFDAAEFTIRTNSEVPEPTSGILFTAGMLGFSQIIRRRRNSDCVY